MNNKEFYAELLQLSYKENLADSIETKLPYVHQMRDLMCSYLMVQYTELGFSEKEVLSVFNHTIIELLAENKPKVQLPSPVHYTHECGIEELI
jgi:hypothetical protein